MKTLKNTPYFPCFKGGKSRLLSFGPNTEIRRLLRQVSHSGIDFPLHALPDSVRVRQFNRLAGGSENLARLGWGAASGKELSMAHNRARQAGRERAVQKRQKAIRGEKVSKVVGSSSPFTDPYF